MIELISFGYRHDEAEEGRNRPPIADITIDLSQHIRDDSATVALLDARAVALGAFAGSSARLIHAARSVGLSVLDSFTTIGGVAAGTVVGRWAHQHTNDRHGSSVRLATGVAAGLAAALLADGLIDGVAAPLRRHLNIPAPRPSPSVSDTGLRIRGLSRVR
ncbi:hypothetical protein OG894_42015 (plasmid) [Streptomyces sp. NBC_01724]|uniref:hypothetical protein n=1 Tax=Streptomyces sp. NBC_01724 TaxID=2975922 RepID=UPI002E32EB87|nr:hypothetical protein [Streptomyces sp. NBC_01724]